MYTSAHTFFSVEEKMWTYGFLSVLEKSYRSLKVPSDRKKEFAKLVSNFKSGLGKLWDNIEEEGGCFRNSRAAELAFSES